MWLALRPVVPIAAAAAPLAGPLRAIEVGEVAAALRSEHRRDAREALLPLAQVDDSHRDVVAAAALDGTAHEDARAHAACGGRRGAALPRADGAAQGEVCCFLAREYIPQAVCCEDQQLVVWAPLQAQDLQ
jgi:hypothetical protein